MRLSRSLSLAATSLTTIAAGLVAVAPAQAATTAPEISAVDVLNEAGGLTYYVPIYCTVVVRFSDATPVESGRYAIRVRDAAGKLVVNQRAYGDGSQFSAPTPCYDLEAGQPHTIEVVEKDVSGRVTTTSAPRDFVFEYTSAPSEIIASGTKKGDGYVQTMGTKQGLTFKGEWEPGTRFRTQVWTTKTRDIVPTEYDANLRGGAAIVKSTERSTPVMSWTPRPRDAGRWAWISILGKAPGKGAWRFTWKPMYIEPAAHPRSFWSALGTRAGAPAAGRMLSVTTPRPSATGKAASARATYQWFDKQRGRWAPIKGNAARQRTFRIPRSLAGRAVKVRVTYRALGYTTFSRELGWTVRR